MMYVTTRNSNDRFIDDFFRDPFWSTGSEIGSVMRTDVKEKDHDYVMTMELPGVSKDDIKIDLKDGYLTVSAAKSSSKDDRDGKYIRKERFEGSFRRSFYVGDYATEENVKASFKDGVLILEIPKEPEPIPEQPKRITIQ